MAFYKRSDMIYEGYSWKAYGNDDPKVTGDPDSTLFSRKEGYEVLYFINKLAEKHKLKLKKSGEKIEKMINEYLPSNVRSQSNVEEWIVKNWKNY